MVAMLSSQGRSTGHVWQAVLMMGGLTYLAGLSLNIVGVSVAFTFIPLIGICLWPRDAGTAASTIIILIFGLILDFISFGPLGLWALVFLTVFAIFRPNLRLKTYDFRQAAMRWSGALGLALILAFFLGWFSVQNRPDILPLLYQALIATAVFPLIYAIRHVLKSLFSDPEDRGL